MKLTNTDSKGSIYKNILLASIAVLAAVMIFSNLFTTADWARDIKAAKQHQSDIAVPADYRQMALEIDEKAPAVEQVDLSFISNEQTKKTLESLRERILDHHGEFDHYFVKFAVDLQTQKEKGVTKLVYNHEYEAEMNEEFADFFMEYDYFMSEVAKVKGEVNEAKAK